MAAVLSTIAAVAWAQNLEVKGNAWFATSGSGNAGIGTASPLAKLHVIAPGGFPGENPDGTSLPGNVPVVAQGNSTVFGILNAHGKQAGAINVDNEGTTATPRGSIGLYDKADGSWHLDLTLSKGNVGIGTAAPAALLDVNGNALVRGSVGIRTTAPTSALDVAGRIRARDGTAVYIDQCSTGALTTSPTCNQCVGCQSGDQWFSCCYTNVIGNPLVGRLVDP